MMGNNLWIVASLMINIRTSSSLSQIPHGITCRRAVIEKAIALPVSIAIVNNNNNVEIANAASPLEAGEADNIGARIERKWIRPKVPRVLRQKLDQSFAVLLMRSSYNALDELDCVGMDQFQRDFFLIRQAEYLPYIESLGPGSVMQGELTDPNYFDFISFAQYAAINREMSGNPPVVFTERQGVPDENDPENTPMKFVPTIVRRKTEYLDNSKLPIEHDRMVGNAILQRFDHVFRDTPSALPTFTDNQKPDSQILLSAFNQMLKLFLINGFAYDADVIVTSSSSKKGTKYAITLISPATLWSGKSLQSRSSKVANDFVLKTIKVFIKQRTAYNVLNPSVKYVDNKEITSFTIA